MSEQEAFNATMMSASPAAQEFAQTMSVTGASVAAFTVQQKQAEVAAIAQNQSFKNAKLLIAEYNSGCRSVGLSQTQFVDAIGQSNKGLAEYLSGLNGANGTMRGYIASLIGTKVATIAVRAATIALNMALTMGISLAFQGLINIIRDYITTTEEARKAAEEAGETFRETVSSIDDYKSQIAELRDELDSANLSEEEAYEKRQQLLSIQDDIVENLGSEAAAFDILADSIGNVNKSLSEKAAIDARTLLSDNDSSYKNAQEKIESTGNWGNGASNAIYSSTAYTVDENKEIIDKVKEIFTNVFGDKVKFTEFGDDGKVSYVLDVDAKTAVDGLKQVNSELYALDSQLELNDGRGLTEMLGLDAFNQTWENAMTVASNDAQNVLDKWESIYDDYIQNKILASYGEEIDYTKYIDEINQFKDAYDEAISSGDSAAIQEAWNNMQSLIPEIEEIDDESIRKYFLDLINSWNEANKQYELNVELRTKLTKSNEIKDELDDFSEGGNVDLTNRPVIDTSELVNAGWEDAGEGVATVFTNTFSNEAGNIAMNFTPIMTDENGNYTGVLSPDELTEYAEDVIAGVREDDLNLQIGGAFTGDDAIEQAVSAAEKIHELQGSYYLSDDEFTKGVKSAIEKFEQEDGTIDKYEVLNFGAEFENSGKTDGFTEQEEAYNTLQGAAEQYGMEVSDLLDLLAQLGIISLNTADDLNVNIDTDTESVTNLISGINAVQDALNSQQTGISIAVDDFNSDELKDYQSALEYVNGTMQLNAEKVREIAKAKAEEQIATNNTNKALEQTKYLENAKQIAEYRKKLEEASFAEGETAESVQSSIDALLVENSTIAETCKQYDLLSSSISEAVGAYQNWLNAQSASDYGDMADDMVAALQRIRDTFDTESDIYWNIGSEKFEAAVEFAVPDSVDKEDVDAIEAWKDDFAQYLNFDDDGNIDSLNIDKFLSNAVEAGLMNYDDENGFTVAGQKSMDDFADGLNMSAGMVQAFFDELQLYGGKFDWSDEATKTFGDMAVEANEAAEALRKIDGNSDLKILLDVSEFEDASKACETLDSTIAEMNTVKAKPNVDSSEVEYANSVIEYCVAQKQLLNAPAIMSVDTSQVTGELGDALSLLQEFQEAQNKLEVYAAIGADTTEAQNELDSLTAEIQSLSPEIKADIGIDDTSSTTIQSYIKELSADAIIAFGVDSSLVEGYEIVEHNADGTVTWNNDISEVTSWINQSHVANGVIYWGNDTSKVKTNFTASGTTGTTQLYGTAHASGNWGTATGGRTLVGELGREIVVDPHTGKWYTVGDNGAEFRDIPTGAIVFNHLQTEHLLENGYVSGRASALVNGTAMLTGGIKYPTGKQSFLGSGTSSGSSGSSSSSSGTSSGSSNNDDDDTEIIDWIEIAIDRIERAINNLSTVAKSAFRTLSEKLTATNDEISEMTYELSVQQGAYDRYMQEANSVGLSSNLAAKVQNGTIDINEYDGDTADKINDYQEWYEKAIDCSDAILELSESIAELYQNKFDDVASDYENQLSLLEHLTNTYNNGIDDLEEKGYLASTKYYTALQDVETQNIAVQKKKLADLTKAMSEAINSGYIEKGSEAWYEMQQEINSVTEAIQESETALVEYANAIRNIKWERFDYIQEQISNITEEADFLIDLLDNSDLYTDNGQLTDIGTTAMGLHGQNYNVYMAQADKYAEELLALNEEIANDPNNTTLLERREELLEAQRESILAAEDEKQAIVDMVEEGIELELNALQELIDKYEENLDSAKDLYDYNKKLKDQTSEIASLQKQLSAYSGDTSEETRATIQKIQMDLADAMEDLEETQYEHYISEQKKMLDNLYDEYETILNQRLDDVDALISDMIDMINVNAVSISDTIIAESEAVGYTLSEAMREIWTNEGGAYSIISKYGESFTAQFTSINTVLNSISANVAAMVTASDEEVSSTVNSVTSATAATSATSSAPSNNAETSSNRYSNAVKQGVAAAIWAYGSKSGWGSGATRKKRLTEKFGSANASAIQSYINAHSGNGDLYNYWVSTGKSSLSQYYYSAFKNGGLADYTGMAWLDGTPAEPEMVLSAEDTANFIALKDAMRSVANGTSPLTDLFNGEYGASDILQQLAKIESPIVAGGTNIGDITYQVSIPIDHVQDYDDFMNQMRKDGKFEKMIQSMTVDRLTGGSKIAKNKYQW